MKRLHIHVGVDDLEQGIRFYSALFAAEPVKTRTDYAKWELDDPHVNFAISTRASTGVEHLGMQVESGEELEDLRQRLRAADLATYDDGETVCCYARSDKTWVRDPAGVPWESYHTMGDAQFYGDEAGAGEEACCTPETRGEPGCCVPTADSDCCN